MLNGDALWKAVEQTRWNRHLIWKDVAAQAGVRKRAFSDLRRGRGLNADTLLKIMTWLGETDVTPYIRRGWEPM